jgi:hypothetical protein
MRVKGKLKIKRKKLSWQLPFDGNCPFMGAALPWPWRVK